MTAGAHAWQRSAPGTRRPTPEKRRWTGSSLGRAEVHFLEQWVFPAVVGMQVGAVAKAMRSQTRLAVAADPGDTRLDSEVFLSRVVLPR
jgi:hypothetical protein